MPFIGKQPTAGFASIVKDDFTADGSTTVFTLSKQVANANDIAVFVGNVRQEPTDAYTVNGTTLTMSAAPASAINFYVLHIAGTVESSVIPADGTISSAKIVSGAVTDAKIAGMSSSKLTGALPALDGSALTGAGGLVKLEHISVDAAGATDYAFNFTDVFSTTYDDYFFQFHVASYQTTGSENVANTFYAQFGNNGTYVTANNTTRGANRYLQHDVTAAGNGQQYYYSTMGIHQLLGTLTTTENGVFSGTGIIKGVNTTYWPTQIIINNAMMQYFTTQANTWMEWTASREDNSTKNSYTDVRFGIIQGDSNGGNLNSANSRRDAYGEMTIYGMAK